MKRMLCPSMMCANFKSLESEVSALNAVDIDVYHIDIMDGKYVPNFGMGLQDLEFIRNSTDKMVDVHLMIEHPSEYVDFFAEKGVNIIYFHPEADLHPARTIDRIHSQGIKAGIALNPGTSIEMVKPLLSLVDYVLVMTVNPGFAGQKYLEFVNEKITELNALRKKARFHFEMVVDGAISPEKIKELTAIGVNGFVLGTSALFKKTEPYEMIISKLRAI